MDPLLPSLEERQLLVSSFLQIVVGQTTAIATQFLQVRRLCAKEARWNLHDAIRLFFYVKDSGGVSSHSMPPPTNGNLSELESSIGNISFVRDDPVDEARPSSLARLQSGQVVAPCNDDSVSRRSAVRGSKESAPSTVSLPFPEKGSTANHMSLCQKRPREYDSVFTNIQDTEDPSKRQCLLDNEPNRDKNGGAFSSGKLAHRILPEEPKDTKEVCRIRIRLPDDGRFIQRNFLRTDPIELLWPFCSSLLENGQGHGRGFHFTQAIPGASKNLEYNSNLTFEEAGLSDWVVTLVLD
ncbi:plant UBX domain-containing protein 7-like isoform X1 [Zingiber officinale]|uniref:plant UBX domain-containing protein 7-like isoform X1 n=1 Tax=Zingiber officinale TaxID=94328 RepID=UPI001C4C667E|nr:plant UBX domain-containing protein 7-like isoform X1 [Zingiber officinale]